MSISSLTQRRRVYKQLRAALALPDPVGSEDGYLMFTNEDLCNMDRIELNLELDRAKLMLMLQEDKDAIIAMSPGGKPITAQAWLLRRLDSIMQAIEGAV